MDTNKRYYSAVPYASKLNYKFLNSPFNAVLWLNWREEFVVSSFSAVLVSIVSLTPVLPAIVFKVVVSKFVAGVLVDDAVGLVKVVRDIVLELVVKVATVVDIVVEVLGVVGGDEDITDADVEGDKFSSVDTVSSA